MLKSKGCSQAWLINRQLQETFSKMEAGLWVLSKARAKFSELINLYVINHFLSLNVIISDLFDVYWIKACVSTF